MLPLQKLQVTLQRSLRLKGFWGAPHFLGCRGLGLPLELWSTKF